MVSRLVSRNKISEYSKSRKNHPSSQDTMEKHTIEEENGAAFLCFGHQKSGTNQVGLGSDL